MRGVTISVDYSDLLEITLPYNLHHFKDFYVISTPDDLATHSVCSRNGVTCLKTNLFYENGAVFNKWAALEWGLDQIGRYGWLCLIDADVLWPKYIPEWNMKIGNLYTPMRRMAYEIAGVNLGVMDVCHYPLHKYQAEFAGYTQIFHADDPHLPDPPWHQIDWKHAGGADSYFQMMWPIPNKVRPPFECLHLGEDGQNWCGRVTKYTDGTIHVDSPKRRKMLDEFRDGREGKFGMDRHNHERLM